MSQKWSEDRKARLTAMWNDGSSSGEISAALGDVSRNAVMGMVNRLGLMKSAAHASRSHARVTGCCAPGWTRPAERAAVATHPGDDAAGGTQAPIATQREAPMPPAPEVPPAPEKPQVSEVPSDRREGLESLPVTEIAADPIAPVAVRVAEPVQEPDPVSTAAPPEVEMPPAPPEVVTAEASADEDEDEDEDLDMDDEFIRAELEYEAAAVAAASPRAEEPPVVSVPPAEVVETPPAQPILVPSQALPSRPAVRPARKTTPPAATKPRQGVPSARPWTPSRMPASTRRAPPPPEVSISSGVISTIAVSSGSVPDWREAFSLLERLTGVSYDERVPGHVPALVAIATVLSKGDPRRVLSPKIPEQSVLRVMRRFAERGAVVAGKPPERWLVDVDDGAFYREMVEVGAAV